ncbi:MAG: WD40 repeat domain-containing protein [Oscillospiraceae bacterium]|nr:WD40 repeat domain-containing protein [Oscillospiraceae bacterium]
MSKRRAKVLTVAFGIAVIAAIVSFFSIRIPVPPLQVGFLFYGAPTEDTAQYFEQPLIYSMDFSRISVADTVRLSHFDLIVIDESVTAYPGFSDAADKMRTYIEGGGRVALTGSARRLLEHMKPEAAHFARYTPAQGISLDGADSQFSQLGQIFADYMHYFVRFRDYEYLRDRHAGYALQISQHITPIVYSGDRSGAIAAKLKLGQGAIFYFGALLPDNIFTTSFDFVPRNGQLPYFNNTAAAASHLLWNELASSISKDVRGFTVRRVFGSHGRPSMAHQTHSEVLSALGHGYMEIWAEMAQRHGQIASFSIALGRYEWFLRYESFGYALRNSDGSFQNDRADDFYAWGTHIVHDGRWLNLARSDSRLSFFDDPQEATRSFPSVIDFNGDGIPDLISGSSDGFFHVFEGVSMEPRWTVEARGLLLGPDGEPLSTGAFSAPSFRRDPMRRDIMVSGSYSGNVYIWEWHGGLQTGDLLMVIPPPEGETLSAPDISEYAHYLTVGFASGNIYIYEYLLLDLVPPYRIIETGEKNAAPRAFDASGSELVVGTHNGDILHYIRVTHDFGEDWERRGNLRQNAYAGPDNFKGIDGINTGNNVTPLLADLNGDGHLDLVWGLLEYGGFSVSMTDDLFPYRAELIAALKSLEGMFVPINLHSFTHNYKTLEDERLMLEAELAALRAYGIESPTGVNQHTWWTSAQSHGQTLFLQLEKGFLWNLGFRPSNSPANPSYRAEFGIISPFYLHGENGRRMLLYNANYLHDGFWAPARYDFPITIYSNPWRGALYNHQALEDFIFRIRDAQEAHLFNFVTETQLVKTVAAAMATDVRIYMRPMDILSDFLRRAMGRTPRFDRFLVTEHSDASAPLFEETYANSIGVRIELCSTLRPFLDTDSPVRFATGNIFYLTLAGGGNRGTRIWTRYQNVSPATHLMAVNLPAEIVRDGNMITVEFLEDGLQQIFLYSESGVDIQNEAFEVRSVSQRIYRISKTGDRGTLEIQVY